MKSQVLLVLGILAISGCTEIGTFGNSKDVIFHPDKYYNQSVSLISTLLSWTSEAAVYGIHYVLEEKDEEGKPVTLYVKYPEFYCKKCEITGIIKSLKTCDCGKYGVVPNGNRYWTSMSGYIMTVEDCNKLNPVFYCKDNVTSDLYYLDVTKVKSLDPD